MIFNGTKIVMSPLCDPRPKMTLSPDVTVSNEFRNEMNAWMLEFFGMHPAQSYVVTDPKTLEDTIYIGSKTYAELKKAMRKEADYMRMNGLLNV